MNQPVYTTSEPKKHPGFILAIDADYFDAQQVLTEAGMASAFSNPINPFPHQLFLDTVQSDLVIREREYLDNGVTVHESRRGADGKFKKGDPRYKQILPYLVARQQQADGTMKFYPYRRTSGVGESRLAGNGSVGYGGHIDLMDVLYGQSSVIDLKTTIENSLLREANEEFVVLDKDAQIVTIELEWFSFGDLFILDSTTPVNELHLGLIMHLDIPQGYTLVATEDELAKLPPMTAEQMLTDESFKPESWTQIYLNYFLHGSTGTLNIDHGGEQVGQVSQTFFDGANLQALEAGVGDIDNMAATGFANSEDTVVDSPLRASMPNPTEADLQDPVFHAIYEAAKTWDVGAREFYAGYCGFNGSHAKLLTDAVYRSVQKGKVLHFDIPAGEDPVKFIADKLREGGSALLEVTEEEEAEWRQRPAANDTVSKYSSEVKAEVLRQIDAHQDAHATAETPFPLVEESVANEIARKVTGDPEATFHSVVGDVGNWRDTKASFEQTATAATQGYKPEVTPTSTGGERVASIDTRTELDAALDNVKTGFLPGHPDVPTLVQYGVADAVSANAASSYEKVELPAGVSVIPDDYKGIDWNNALTGSTQNTVNLNLDDLQRQREAGAVVTNSDTGTTAE